VIDALVAEVRGVVVEAEALVTVDGFDGALGGGGVEGDFGWVDFEREIDVHFVKLREDRLPAVGEIIETLLPIFLIGGREGVDRMPDARAGEAIDDSAKAGG